MDGNYVHRLYYLQHQLENPITDLLSVFGKDRITRVFKDAHKALQANPEWQMAQGQSTFARYMKQPENKQPDDKQPGDKQPGDGGKEEPLGKPGKGEETTVAADVSDASDSKRRPHEDDEMDFYLRMAGGSSSAASSSGKKKAASAKRPKRK
tara:strand:+ start:1112 stop:1567 length:456 start_codon:yes stop_codon:yes gene_type:complete